VPDVAVKGCAPEFFKSLYERFQILYSDETVREIKRGGQPGKFLVTLTFVVNGQERLGRSD
jgi:hypothetical protein